MTEHDPILAAIQAAQYAESIMRRSASGDDVPVWPKDMAHHLDEPTGYSAGYAAHFHPDFRDPTDDSYGRDYEDLENSYHAAGGTGPDFGEGVDDAANGISHKLDDPENYHGYQADQDAQVKRNRDSVNQQKQDEHNRLRENGKPTFRLDNEPEMPKGLGFGIDRGVTTSGPDYDNHPEGSWEGCPTCSDNGYGPKPVNYTDPDEHQDPFDPRLIGAGLHARLAAKSAAVDPGVMGRIAAELSPPCPDCGQVAGFDEHMVSPRIRVCRNCEYPMTEVGHDYLLDRTLSGHDQAISDLPEIDHPTLGKHGRYVRSQYDDLPPLPGDFHVPDSIGGEKNTSGVEPWMDPEEFIKYHNDYFGKESDPTTQSNIRDMSTHSLHSYWQDLEKAKGKTPDQMRDERQQSKDKAKGIADGLWNAMYPPEEEEGRKSVQNMDTVNNLMNQGWQPEHIKYDEDDQPYGHYQHPSGWNVKDYGGNYKEIGHAATPDESHDVINVSRYDKDSGQDYNDTFGPADAHAHIEEQLHGDPEETGGTFHYLTQNDPRIKKYKPPTH